MSNDAALATYEYTANAARNFRADFSLASFHLSVRLYYRLTFQPFDSDLSFLFYVPLYPIRQVFFGKTSGACRIVLFVFLQTVELFYLMRRKRDGRDRMREREGRERERERERGIEERENEREHASTITQNISMHYAP